MTSAAAMLAVPLGGWWVGGPRRLLHPDRLAHGLAVVLPGIEGRGSLNWGICRGLTDGGFPGAVLLYEWTTGLWPLMLFHLRSERRNRRQAGEVARLVLSYQETYPGRPVYLLGHSGGAAVAVWALEALPEGRRVTGAVLLAPALSPSYSLGRALAKVETSLWHFWSPLDLFFLGACTLLFGTADGRHSVAAGLCGFSVPEAAVADEKALYRARLRQERYDLGMARRFHLGGHFGSVNRVFVAETVAPHLFGGMRSMPCQNRAA
jgi:pimeloyl-ACP methyl ester carboxylesterase